MPKAQGRWLTRPAITIMALVLIVAFLSKLAIERYREAEVRECIATGGKTFAYLMRRDSTGGTPTQWAVIKLGNCPLHNLQMRVADMDVPDERGWNVFSSTWGQIDAPSLVLPGAWPVGAENYYRIFFTARNGSWYQDLILHQGRLATTRVFSSRGKLMFEHTEDPSLSPRWRP